MVRIIPRNGLAVQGNWQKELANAITNPKDLLKRLQLAPENHQQDIEARKLFPMRVPMSFVNRIEKGNPKDPLLLQVLPLAEEFIASPGFTEDPLGEHQSAVPGLLHKYQSRVLFIVRGGCAVNCRYCFRRHFPYQDNSPNKAGWQQALDYIRQDKNINEVIFSGGDPLMANDQQLAWLVGQLEQIPHLRRLRIHSRLPVVIPNRITDELVSLLQDTRLQCVMVSHINHPNEINDELRLAYARLHKAGISLLNQAVLLKGINDNADTLAKLSEQLFASHIMPYYLFLLDKVAGAAHFDSSEEKAVAIMRQLYKLLPGYLVPRLSREQAGKSSKTPIDIGLS
ncbi:EF-P beta-lysylation protein EpmB [Agarivorans sp. MS3-6]|uniref:EF-P beta-lysylation protein EpmB n=1 Tax=Agarivorans sp. TSD2052 TaxID=2937286 RepID=UPI00200DC3B5|nr:EF-P beta-lysylation protein EpmB [Agarivorans sp. TSD2052]UPW18065.1 EF-P beta-lysylation protein EpmB [Agarivorans sp. TSD2052]